MIWLEWIGVTLYYDSAWWDNRRKAWVDEHFHLIDHVVIRRTSGGGGRARSHPGRSVPWSFAWNDVVFQSFQVGYLRPLDMRVYRELKSPAAKRMYRFLDKRFWWSNHLEFDLRVFACEHIGFSRAYDNGQLKRRLNPAVAELEKIGYLEPLPSEDRFLKVCHGMWKIRLVRRQSMRQRRKRDSRWHVLEQALVERGVTAAVATRLVREYPHKVVREKVVAFDQLRTTNASFELRNPAGFLVNSIQNSSPCLAKHNPEFRTTAGRGRASGRSVDTRGGREKRAQQKRQQDEEGKAIEEYLAKLSVEEIEKLETEAFQHADPLVARGYERCCRDANTRLSQEYLAMILHAHVRNIMGLDGESR